MFDVPELYFTLIIIVSPWLSWRYIQTGLYSILLCIKRRNVLQRKKVFDTAKKV